MLGTIVNTLSIIAGSLIGLLFRRGLSPRFNEIIMKGIGLCVLVIGIQGAMKSTESILVILSIVIGSLIGEALKLETQLTKLAHRIQKIFQRKSESNQFADGFISATMIFCVGAMAIVGSLQSGLLGNHEMLFTKSILDGITSVLLATSHGLGVMFSAAVIFIYQGSITLLAGFVEPYLSDIVVEQMSAIGSILLIGLALNVLEIAHLRVMNYVPAIFVPIIWYTVLQWF